MASSGTEQLSGKVAIITGASSGIGEAIAVTFARYGATITLTGRHEARLKEVKDKCVSVSGGRSERFIIVSGDLRNQETRGQIVNTTVAQFGKLDILVCNAGVLTTDCTITKATEEVFDFIFDVNVKAIFFLIQTALPHLEKSKGNILPVSSMVSKLPWSPILIYPMTKAAVDHMVNCLALELASRGIRVNTLNPSYVVTRIIRPTSESNENELLAEAMAVEEREKQPIDQRLVTVEELAEAAAFLVSDKASFITGQHLNVDGGRMLTGPLLFGS